MNYVVVKHKDQILHIKQTLTRFKRERSSLSCLVGVRRQGRGDMVRACVCGVCACMCCVMCVLACVVCACVCVCGVCACVYAELLCVRLDYAYNIKCLHSFPPPPKSVRTNVY